MLWFLHHINDLQHHINVKYFGNVLLVMYSMVNAYSSIDLELIVCVSDIVDLSMSFSVCLLLYVDALWYCRWVVSVGEVENVH